MVVSLKELNTRDKILRAATELFSEKPYHETSVGEIAKRAGVSKGALFHYFPSKYELARQVLLGILDAWLKRLNERLKNLTGDAKIRAVVDALFELITESPKLSRFFLEVYEESLRLGRGADWDEFYGRYLGSVSEILKNAGVANPERKTVLLGALVDGLALHHLLSGGRLFNVEDMKEEVFRILKG